jgi:hypothetical protein
MLAIIPMVLLGLLEMLNFVILTIGIQYVGAVLMNMLLVCFVENLVIIMGLLFLSILTAQVSLTDMPTCHVLIISTVDYYRVHLDKTMCNVLTILMVQSFIATTILKYAMEINISLAMVTMVLYLFEVNFLMAAIMLSAVLKYVLTEILLMFVMTH